MDAVVKNFPKPSPAPEKPLSDHVRAAPRRPFRAPRATKPRRRCARCSPMWATIPTARAWSRRRSVSSAPTRSCSPATRNARRKSSTAPSRKPAATTSSVLVRDIPFYSHCEHHVMPFTGKAHIAYAPTGRVVGLSKIARLIDVYARRLQTQEHLTAQIATAIDEILKPRGVAVMLEAEHTCMSMRGVASRARSPSRPNSPACSATRRSRRGSSPWCGAASRALERCITWRGCRVRPRV